MPVRTHGTLIHRPPPPPGLQILISGWHEAKIDFFDKKFNFCHIFATGGPFHIQPPYFEGA